MTLYQLKIFEAVARHLNITQAALELHASQPAVSQQLKLLEEHYEARFLVRHSHGVKLTDKGRAFLDAIKPVLADIQDIERKFKGNQNTKSFQCLAVGGSDSLSVRVFPKILRAFKESHPAVQFMLAANESSVIEKQLLNSELEIGVITNPSSLEGFVYEPYDQMKVVAFCLPDNPVAGKTLSLKELGQYPIIVKSPGRIEKVLMSQGCKMNVALRCEASEMIKAAVRLGMGIGISYENTIAGRLSAGNLKLVDVPELKQLGIQSFIVYDGRKLLSPMAQEFLALLLERKQSVHKTNEPVTRDVAMTNGSGQKLKRSHAIVIKSSLKGHSPLRPSID